MALYEKPVRLLFRNMVKDLKIQKSEVLVQNKLSTCKTGHYFCSTKLSTDAQSRIHYNVDPDGKDDLLFQFGGRKFRLYASDPEPVYYRSEEIEGGSFDSNNIEQELESEFAYEKNLQNLLVKNLSLIEPGLSLY